MINVWYERMEDQKPVLREIERVDRSFAGQFGHVTSALPGLRM
jgi:hypothetical protein